MNGLTQKNIDINRDSGLMHYAAQQLKHLRRSNEIMSARLGVFDDMMAMFKKTDSNGMSMRGEGTSNMTDIVYQLEDRANVLSVVEALHPEMQSNMTNEAMGGNSKSDMSDKLSKAPLSR